MDPRELEESGVLLVDKPAAWTSHDVVKFVRGFGIRKVGHCGTLDPAATGLLILVLGRATRLTERFSGQDKVYQGTMRLGIETYSHDADGEVVAERDWTGVTEEQLRQAVATFVGEQQQVPPMVSAKKQDGQKLYQLARRGIEVERAPRPITVYAFDLERVALPEADFTIRCSKGTYVRTLCHDLGQRLGCGAHLQNLRRLVSGRFHLEAAYPLDQIRTWNRAVLLEKIVPLAQVLEFL